MLITDISSPERESYASVADLRQLASKRGDPLPTEDAACESLLIKAMDYLAGLNWQGKRTTASQPLAWPRSGVIFDGYLLPENIIPSQLLQVQCRLALTAQAIDLTPSFSGGKEVVQESIAGAVSVTYASGSASSPHFSWLPGLLRGLLISSRQSQLVRG
ncbi:DnaT-like ssDNA-binding protein [Candidatus Fukatsuia endosymbiont of Tuberolachnus salignus]|uniref:DnaT-like ssDNA-binding protein n=1 Tax=Candidatus Fukatsuia endosymbiont of Tuberolachnus salignus TaxID=3077957 RepID=UPI00313B93D3